MKLFALKQEGNRTLIACDDISSNEPEIDMLRTCQAFDQFGISTPIYQVKMLQVYSHTTLGGLIRSTKLAKEPQIMRSTHKSPRVNGSTSIGQ
jgi:hypothetical protein